MPKSRGLMVDSFLEGRLNSFSALPLNRESNRGQRVVVMGATNRPWMVDEAVLRRFSTQYEVGGGGRGQGICIHIFQGRVLGGAGAGGFASTLSGGGYWVGQGPKDLHLLFPGRGRDLLG